LGEFWGPVPRPLRPRSARFPTEPYPLRSGHLHLSSPAPHRERLADVPRRGVLSSFPAPHRACSRARHGSPRRGPRVRRAALYMDEIYDESPAPKPLLYCTPRPCYAEVARTHTRPCDNRDSAHRNPAFYEACSIAELSESKIVRFPAIGRLSAVVPHFFGQTAPRMSSRNLKHWKAVKIDVSNNEGTDTFGGQQGPPRPDALWRRQRAMPTSGARAIRSFSRPLAC